MNPRLVIAGAIDEELEPLRELLPEKRDIYFLVTGVGSENAFSAINKMVDNLGGEKPYVLFIGSIGAVDSSVPLFSFVSATSVVPSYDLPSLGEHNQKVESSPALLSLFRKLDCLFEPAYSTPLVTRSEQIASELASSTGARFENLELFGLASACDNAALPWVSYSCVSNHVGNQSHTQWMENFSSAAQKTALKIAPIVPQLLAFC